jgi:hypothetical protein
MKSALLNESLAGMIALACAFTVFFAAALDTPDRDVAVAGAGAAAAAR